MTGVLEGRTALITGASRGIGRAIALAYAREGADVAAASAMHDHIVNAKKQLLTGLGRAERPTRE